MPTLNSLPKFIQDVKNAFQNNDFHYYEESFSEFGDFEDSESITYQLTENGIVDEDEPRALAFSFSELQSKFEDYIEMNPTQADYELSDQLNNFFYNDFI